MSLGALPRMQYVLLRWFHFATQLRLLRKRNCLLLAMVLLLVYQRQYHRLVFKDRIAPDEHLRVVVAENLMLHVVQDRRVLLVRLRHGPVQ